MKRRSGPGFVILLGLAMVGIGCSAPGPSRLVVLGTTDVHAHLLPYRYATDEPTENSLAQVATLVDSIREAEPRVVLVDSGDLLQGTPLGEYQARVARDSVHPAIAAMNAMEYDAAALGNHEFNYGLDFLEAALAEAEFPFLAANIHAHGRDSLPFPPYTLVDRDGLVVGVLGLTTPGVALWDRAHVEGRLDFRDLVAAARVWVPRLREAGADVIVVAAHSGVGPGSSYGDVPGVPEENAVARLAIEVPGIDVIFAGHTSEPIGGLRVGGTLILHAGRAADHLAVAELTVRRTRAGVEVVSEGSVISTRGVRPDPALRALVADAHERTVAWLGEPIGWTPDRWSADGARFEDTPIVDLIGRVQAEVTGAELSAAAIFDRSAGFGPGPITRRDILGLYIYPNTLRAVLLSGADLRAYLERSALYFRTWPTDRLVNDSVPGYNFDMLSGVDYALDLRREPGRRLVSLRYGDAPVAPTDSFTLAVNSYRQAGGGGFGMVADAAVVYADETDVASRILEFVARRDTLRIEDVFRRNWELRPEEAVRRTPGGGP